MDEDPTQLTQNTQGVFDPRRIGRNNSGLNDADISDVMCILHPCSPAAFKIVAETAERSPHNVLQNDGHANYDDGVTLSAVEEQETFIIQTGTPLQPMDLALRFSARLKNAKLGFVFGRNAEMSDIVLATDTYKRVSNIHFSIFMNASGVLMLQDMSTNGTIVDHYVLKGKSGDGPQTRMLNPGSIVQILSPKPEEIVKFIVRIPSREGHIEEYEARFQIYRENVVAAEAQGRENNLLGRRLAPPVTRNQSGTSITQTLMHTHYGMHWSGGEIYNVVGQLGKGAFASVYQLATKSEGHLYVAKELEKRRFVKNGILDRKMDNEMQIMKAVSHPSIVQYIDYVDYINHMYIIMEFVPYGDLQQYLVRQGPLVEDQAKRMAVQVLEALEYLHKKKITHRDIKPDNILIANLDPANFTVKLSDFGLSKVVQDDETFLKTFCGTLLYCAPEVFPHYDAHMASKGKKRPRRGNTPQSSKFHSYSQSVDIWSFGAVLWYSLCFKPPFEGVADANGRGMFDKIMRTPLDVTDLVKQGVSDDAVALLVDMLNTDPASRPSPTQCLRHKWFNRALEYGKEDVTDGLLAIVEEEEPDVAALSLDEQEGPNASQLSELSIHSGSLEFLDPRQSKRFKSGVHSYREHDEALESSQELAFQSVPIIYKADATAIPSPQETQRPVRRKLFGEISQSALGQTNTDDDTAAGALRASSSVNGRSRDGENWPGHEEQAQPAIQSGAHASPSLLGAESLVRELHMNSPRSHGSRNSISSDSIGPHTPDRAETTLARAMDGASDGREEVTPKQPQRSIFNRQINIPLPASFYYVADDPSTHNLEYASKVSGYDFATNPGGSSLPEETSLPATASASATDDDAAGHDDDKYSTSDTNSFDRRIDLPVPSQFIKPPPRLGRLVTTADSFTPLTLNITTRITSWGRAPSNSHPYADKYDTRIPKRGIIIWFHARGIEKIPEEDQSWMKLPDLHCIVYTESSLGVEVNGVTLRKGETGKIAFGRVYTGDSITVAQKGRDGKILSFICEFFHGEARGRRPDDGPRFQVETADLMPPKVKQGEEAESAIAEPIAAA